MPPLGAACWKHWQTRWARPAVATSRRCGDAGDRRPTGWDQKKRGPTVSGRTPSSQEYLGAEAMGLDVGLIRPGLISGASMPATMAVGLDVRLVRLDLV